MDNPEIVASLTDIFREVLNKPNLTLTPEMVAADVPEWDSIAHISIVVAAEMQFGIKFKTAELERLTNVGEIIELIARKVNSKR